VSKTQQELLHFPAGWLNLLGQIAAVSAVAFLCSGLISTMASMASTVGGAEHITFTPAQVTQQCMVAAAGKLFLLFCVVVLLPHHVAEHLASCLQRTHITSPAVV
jgi:amino acid transporter